MKHELVNINLTPGKMIESDGWKVESAAPNYKACNDAAKQRAERMAERSSEATNITSLRMNSLIGGGFLVRTDYKAPEHSSISVELRCFPDTVDPRGPKGK